MLEIKNELKIYYENGINVIFPDGKTLVLDPTGVPVVKPDVIFVSHPHADHASGIGEIDKLNKFKIVMTEETYGIKSRSIKNDKNVKLVYRDPIEIEGVTITVFPSGHCLGSVESLIEYKNTELVFTGDFNLSGTLLEPKPKILNGDVLITEANFGHPFFTFKKRFDVLGDIVTWINTHVEEPKVFFMTGIGKAQELTQLLTQLELDQTVWIHSWYYHINKIFERYRHSLGKYERLDKYSDIDTRSIIIHPPLQDIDQFNGARSEMKRILDLEDSPLIAYVSGWAKWFDTEGAFPLSSHSDFLELIRYARKSLAETVYTFHGFAETLANELRTRFDTNATPLTKNSYPDFIKGLDSSSLSSKT